MIIEYFKIAFRNFFKYKVFSAINVLGISIGMTASIFVLIYVLYETSFDRFHKNAKQLYRVEVDTYRDDALENESALTSPAVGRSLIDNFPVIEHFTRIASNPGKTIIISNDKSYREEKTYLVDSALLTVFDIELVQGNPQSALSHAFNIIISEKLAEKLFGADWKTPPVLEQTIDLRSQGLTGTFKIAGVFKNLPSYSHFKPEILASNHYLRQLVGDLAKDDSWNFNFFYTYVKLAAGADPTTLQSRFNTYVQNTGHATIASDNIALDFRLRPLTDIHLKSRVQFELESNGDVKTVYALALVGIITLVVAWINFVNLTTARSLKRAKEVGVRKVLGASKAQLVKQFSTEAVLINVMALAIALVVIELTKSVFGELSGIPFDFITVVKILAARPQVSVILVIIFLSGITLSGIYPAFVLSSFNPVKALKSNVLKPDAINLRAALVTVQFIVSVVMISGTVIIFKQVSFMRSTDLGIDIEKTVIIELPENFDQMTTGAAAAFKTSIRDFPFVNGVAMSSVVPGNEIGFRSHNLTSDKTRGTINCGIAGIDQDYFNDYKIQTIAGKPFSFSDNDKDKIIINEEAAKQLGYRTLDEALGSKLTHHGKRLEVFEVIGVVRNFHHRSLKNAVEPIMFLNGRDLQFYSVKLKSNGWKDLQRSINTLSQAFEHYFPGNPFNYHFLDQQFDSQYKTEIKFSEVFVVFSAIAVIISSLGLIGISTFMINLRVKEIGIRKVFGASSRGIVIMLSKDYFRLLAIAALIGIPVVWYLSNQWLTEYPYRIDLNVLTLSLPIFILTLILIMTTGLQSVYAASSNPVDSIKNE